VVRAKVAAPVELVVNPARVGTVLAEVRATVEREEPVRAETFRIPAPWVRTPAISFPEVPNARVPVGAETGPVVRVPVFRIVTAVEVELVVWRVVLVRSTVPAPPSMRMSPPAELRLRFVPFPLIPTAETVSALVPDERVRPLSRVRSPVAARVRAPSFTVSPVEAGTVRAPVFERWKTPVPNTVEVPNRGTLTGNAVPAEPTAPTPVKISCPVPERVRSLVADPPWVTVPPVTKVRLLPEAKVRELTPVKSNTTGLEIPWTVRE
jgi:hypothetical protein